MAKCDLAWLIIGVLVIGIFLGVALSCAVYIGNAQAEDNSQFYYCWVMCQPDSEVMIREHPSKNSEVVGALESGSKMTTDGIEENGWVHLVDVNNETGEGWIYAGYISYDEAVRDSHRYCIKSTGRVACRRYIDGPKRRWINSEDELSVYLISDEWCVTDKGFVKTQFIDFGSRIDIEKMNPDDMTWEDD